MRDLQLTEQSLHLLLDGELDSMSSKLLLQKMESDPELSAQYKRLQEIKEMMTFAYCQEKLPDQTTTVKSIAPRKKKIWQNQWVSGLAASLFLSIGLSTGWIAHEMYQQNNPVVVNTVSTQTTAVPQLSNVIAELEEPRKYMIHMSAFDNKSATKTLLETEAILASYAKSRLPVKLDVLVNQQGVQLFDARNLDQLQRIRNLINTHDNINFYACSKSMMLFMQGVKVPDDFSRIHSDRIVEEIIPERINQGWVYLKV